MRPKIVIDVHCSFKNEKSRKSKDNKSQILNSGYVLILNKFVLLINTEKGVDLQG